MKKLYFLFLALLISITSFGQTTIFQESFETGNSGTASEICNDGAGDFFTRTDGSDIGSFYSVNGQDGSYFFAAMDTDGDPCTMATQTLDFDDIDISTYTDLSLTILLAEDKDGSNFDWDAGDNFYIEIDIDNSGSFTKIFQVSVNQSTGFNVSQPMVDTDLDGVGDGAEITDVFAEYAVSIGVGSLLDIRLVFENLAAGDEDIAIDNIRVVDGFIASPTITVGADITGLDYEFDNGPSAEASFTVEGVDLTTDITISPPTNFEISTTSGSGFVSTPIVLAQSGGTVNSQTIYTRLKESLSIGDYTEDITVTSVGATDRMVSLSGSVYASLTNALVITGVYDAQNNSSPKGVELYVLSDIADLSAFALGSANNGGGTDGEEFTFPAVSASTGDRIFVASESIEFNSFFGFAPDYTDGAMGINGDDAIELFENGQVIDVFGDINVDGTGQTWDYVDGWAYRVNSTGPDGSSFIIGNWTFSGTGNLDGTSGNASSTNPYPTSTYSLSIKENQIVGFGLHPNPTDLDYVTISSKSNSKMDVSVFDIIGKEVLRSTVTNNNLDVSALNTGIYILRVSQEGAYSTKRLVIK